MNLKDTQESPNFTDDTYITRMLRNLIVSSNQPAINQDDAPPGGYGPWLTNVLKTLNPQEQQDLYHGKVNLNDIMLMRNLKTFGPKALPPNMLRTSQ